MIKHADRKENKSMQRKKAIVTGGSSGIGRGIVYSLAEDGYDIVFSYRSKKENAYRVLEELRTKYPGGSFEGIEAELLRMAQERLFSGRQWKSWEGWTCWLIMPE